MLPEPCDCAWYDIACWFHCWFGGNNDQMRQDFQAFLNANPNLAWGKPSVQLMANAKVVPPEKHVNNNVATEIVILGTP